jgi:hypothetical protein
MKRPAPAQSRLVHDSRDLNSSNRDVGAGSPPGSAGPRRPLYRSELLMSQRIGCRSPPGESGQAPQSLALSPVWFKPHTKRRLQRIDVLEDLAGELPPELLKTSLDEVQLGRVGW